MIQETKKRVLVINLGWEQEPLLQSLARRDLELFGVHYNDLYSHSNFFKEVLICDLRSLDRILDFANRIRAEAVIADQCDYSFFAQAVIAERLNLPGPRVIQAQIATNKLLQRERAKKMGLLIPQFSSCISIEDIKDFIAEHGYPVIVKPIDNRGSFGVNKISSPDDIAFAYYDALINSHSRIVIVEEFIEGVHITVDGYVFKKAGCRSLSLATKKLIGSNRQVAIDILYPGELSERLSSHALAINEEVNKNLGFDFGMTHSEYMVKDDGSVYLIESANRGGGVFTSEIIVEAVSGIDVVEEYIDDVLDIKHEDRYKEPSRNQVLLKFIRFPPGRVREISLPTTFINDPCIIKYSVSIGPGDFIEEITTDANRHGFIIISASGDIQAKAEDLIKQISVIYEDN